MGQEEEIIDLTEVVEEAGASAAPELKPVPGVEPKGAGDSAGAGEVPKAVPADVESSARALQEEQKEALLRKTEEWMAAEGTRVLERVAREMFPAIAAEVLKQEIEKIKMEAEEKE